MNLKRNLLKLQRINNNHLHDKGYKDLFCKKEIAADLFKNVIKEKWSKEITPINLTLVNKSFVTSDYEDTVLEI